MNREMAKRGPSHVDGGTQDRANGLEARDRRGVDRKVEACDETDSWNAGYLIRGFLQKVTDPFSSALLNRYNARFPGAPKFSAGGAATSMYRGIKLWESAVCEAGTLDQDAVIKALQIKRLD